MTSTDSNWQYEPTPDLEKSIRERLQDFPREPDMLVYGLRAMAMLVFRGWLKLYHRYSVSGRENLPSRGSFVLIANHSSHLDALCLLSALPMRRVQRAFPAAAQDYFFNNIRRTLFSAIFINALPFKRKSAPQQSIYLCRALLERPGNVLIIFPEGTRSVDGTIHSFKPGIGLIAAGLDIPIIPCKLTGCHRAWGKNHLFPKPVRIHLSIGASRTFSDRQSSKENARAIALDLEQTVRELPCDD